MNILFLTDYEISPTAGGIERVIDSLTVSFESKGICCYSAYCAKKNIGNVTEFRKELLIDNNDKENNDIYLFLKDNNIDVIIVAILNKHNLPLMKNLYNITRKLNCKIIYTYHQMPGYELCQKIDLKLAKYWYQHKISNIKEIVIMLILNTINELGIQKILYPIIKRKLSYGLYSDTVCVLSDSYIDLYKKFTGPTEVPFTAMPNALTYFEEVSSDIVDKKEKIVLSVGRFDIVAKRQDLLLTIWSEVEKHSVSEDWKLIIIGYGSEEEYLKEKAKKLKLKNVIFAGFCDPRDYYKKASVYAMTSSYEGFPMVLLEEQQYGVVPLAYDSFVAVNDLIDNGKSGYIVSDKNISEYVSKLLFLMKNRETCDVMAKECMKSINKYSKEVIIERWMTLLNKLCEKK